MNLIHHRGSLFDAPPDAILAHACNCQGVWGVGIAKQFRERFPDEFRSYQMLCSVHSHALVGTARVLSPRVAVLFCSRSYGRYKDSPEDILQYTECAVQDLILQGQGPSAAYTGEIHIPRICSGAFGLPWKRVEAMLQGMPWNGTWHVWSQA